MNSPNRVLIITLPLSVFLAAVLAVNLKMIGLAAEVDQQPKDTNGIWDNYMPENNSYGTKSTPIEYAKMIEPELGVPPLVDCGTGVEIPIYVSGEVTIGNPGLHGCDNPSLQVGDCMPGSSLQRHEGITADGTPLPHVVWVSFCRHDGRDTDEYDVPDSVQLIGYNTVTGATAFFESGDNKKWTYIDAATNRLMGKLPGIDNPDAFNEAYRTPGRVQCIACHQNDPFVHNPFIDAAKLPSDPSQTVVPGTAGRKTSNPPYYVIGGRDWDMRTIHIERNGCLKCHRIGMKTLEEFMADGWHPNNHMPPKNPGSLSKDFQDLVDCWKKGPENTPGCDWVVPPAGAFESEFAGEDYPYKASFNKPATKSGGGLAPIIVD
ncbi:MAG: hypothetical protein VCC01_13405 [Candidatus Hydrogenedentota bacterium]